MSPSVTPSPMLETCGVSPDSFSPSFSKSIVQQGSSALQCACSSPPPAALGFLHIHTLWPSEQEPPRGPISLQALPCSSPSLTQLHSDSWKAALVSPTPSSQMRHKREVTHETPSGWTCLADLNGFALTVLETFLS